MRVEVMMSNCFEASRVAPQALLAMICLFAGGANQAVARDFKPGAAFQDCPNCPLMVVLPPGEYTMGSPASEQERTNSEEPQHRVKIGYSFAVGRFDVTREEFGQFVAKTHYDAKGTGCHVYSSGTWEKNTSANWENPGFNQTGRDPAVCIGWADAKAYVAWLSQKSGKAYRLLSEAEWEYAARGGSAAIRPWGNALSHDDANYWADGKPLAQWRDQWEYTSPVGSFPANRFGLYDMLGNAWQWVEDCWNDKYAGAPADGSPWQSGDCGNRVRRGGSWHDHPEHIRAAIRFWGGTSDHYSNYGFRVARTL